MDMSTVEAQVVCADPDRFRPGDAWLAGGTVLFSYGSATLTRLLDITGAGWEPLVFPAGSTGLEIAATCTVADLWRLPDDPRVPRSWAATDLVRRCCDSFVASWKIWHTATVGGNIATALPAGPMTSLTAALDGVATVLGPGGSIRRQPVLELVTGDATTTLAPGELLRKVTIPAEALTYPTAFRRMSLSERGRSAALVIGRRTPDGSVAVTITAATRRPVRLLLPPRASAEDVATAVDATVPPTLWHDDVHGDPAWRRALARHYAAQVHAELTEAR